MSSRDRRDRRQAFPQLSRSVVGLAGLEPAASSLSGIEGSALCGPAFPQVACERQGRRDAFLATSFQAVQASRAILRALSGDSRTVKGCVAWASPRPVGLIRPAPLLRLDRNVLRLAGRLL